MIKEEKLRRIEIIEDFLFIDDWSWQYSDIDEVLQNILNEYKEDLGIKEETTFTPEDCEELTKKIFGEVDK